MTKVTWEAIERKIHPSASLDALMALRRTMTDVLRDQPGIEQARRYNEAINRLHDTVMVKAIQLAEVELVKNGLGTPPVPYAVVLFGSGGRREQTLWSDQDNGLIYADPPMEQEAAVLHYFQQLADRITGMLAIQGYPLCDGEVTCNYPRWNKPLRLWKEMLHDWQAEASWEAVRYLLIIADMRLIHGDPTLVDELLPGFIRESAARPLMLGRMLENTLRRKPALGLFGHLITERYGEDTGKFDVKYGLYIPFASGIRLLAIQHGIAETSTLGRIERLLAATDMEADLLKQWRHYFTSALYFRMMAIAEEEGRFIPTSMLSIDSLSQTDRNEMKRALRSVRHLQKLVMERVRHPDTVMRTRRDEP